MGLCNSIPRRWKYLKRGTRLYRPTSDSELKKDAAFKTGKPKTKTTSKSNDTQWDTYQTSLPTNTCHSLQTQGTGHKQ